ncbi:hypothetical protein DY000_02016128 [Brassica cretica]|uniref:Pre-mRNA-splicing factor SLU7 n=1 Tax=Brassica cretica TaxID=69181 RepID=A0ABQ7CV97_BRACR|nr:hypothetical protein DY000_02016128 [Brassica cretica]
MAKRPSIDITASTSIDIRSQPSSTVREKAKLNNNYLTPVEFGIFRDPEGYARAIDAGGVDDRFKPKHRQHTRPSIEIGDQTSINRRPEFGKGAYDRDGTWRFQWEEKDEYGVYKDDHGHARDVDGHIIRVSKDDIRSLLERASMDKHNYKSQEKNEADFQMKLDGVYYPLNDSISWLTTCMEEMKQDIARIQAQRAAEATAQASIDRNLSTSIDDEPSYSNPMKSQQDSYTRAEIDQLIEAMQREIVEIQRYITHRPEASTSIDRRIDISTDSQRKTSIDEATPTNQRRLVPKVKSDMSETNNNGKEISDNAYATLIKNQFQLESLEDKLQKIENTTATMKDKGAEEMKQCETSLVHGLLVADSTKVTKVDQPVNYVTPAVNV